MKKMSIILFFDGASLKKTGSSGKIWAIFGMLLDLGPKIRGYFENIIQLFIIGNSSNSNSQIEKFNIYF